MTIEELEQVKLIAEIANLNRPWWQEHFGSIVALVIGLGSFGVAWLTGLFDVKNERLTTERTLLQFDIAKFTEQKDSLNSRLKELTETVKIREGKIAEYDRIVTGLNKEVRNKEIQRAEAEAALKPMAERAEYLEREKKEIEERLTVYNQSLSSGMHSFRETVERLQMKRGYENREIVNLRNTIQYMHQVFELIYESPILDPLGDEKKRMFSEFYRKELEDRLNYYKKMDITPIRPMEDY